MARGAKSGDSHFEDSEMNPNWKKNPPAKPTKESVKARGDAIEKNMSAKYNDPKHDHTKD